jgi:hypothetical protein
MSKLDTAHGPYVDLMSQGRVYVVPEYQRAYSWKPKKQVAELWGDIVRLYRSAVDNSRYDAHFIGSVVIGSASTKALGPVECPVIDGQQRLITLSLIIAAIRDELVGSTDDREQITEQYLAHFKAGAFTAARVRPGSEDRAAFDAIIQCQKVPDRKANVNRTYEYIIERLRQGPVSEEDPDEVPEETETFDSDAQQDSQEDIGEMNDGPSTVAWDWSVLLGVVGTQLELVSISDVAPENAYQIFATLNSTGMPLAQVDLVRNAIFMLMPDQGVKAHQDLWSPMESTMGKDLLQSYLHTWVIRRGHNVPAKEIYRSVIFEFSRAGTKEADIRKLLKQIHDGAAAYLLVTRPADKAFQKFNSHFKPPAGLTKSLIRLRSWGTVPMEPLLVEILNRYFDNDLNQTQVISLMTFLESYVVRRFIVQIPPNDLRSIFARLVQQVRIKTDGAAFVRALEDGLLEKSRRWPTDPEVREALLKRPLYRGTGLKQSFFVLKRIAEAYEGKECPHIVSGTGAADFSIEHVLPQSFPETWATDLAKWGDINPAETWQTLRHTAGNLTLTAYNSELSSLPFVDSRLPMDKHRWIDQSLRLVLSKSIIESDKWTRAEIESRSESMAGKALQIWPRAKG